MSLIKQLWLAVSITIALAFSANFIINMVTSKNYLEQQLTIKNADNATSLALSISQMEKDPVLIELMLSAQFDHGHYTYIKLHDPNEQTIVEKTNTSPSSKVPAWFKRLVHIKPRPGVAQIQADWKQYGTLSLASSADFAYLDLWNGALYMLLWSTIIALICGVLGSLILKTILRPLYEMVEMTDAIGDKNFITIEEPKVLEFKSLANGLNRLSKRIKETLKNQSQLLDQMRLEANYDAVTGLMNRKYFSGRVITCMEDNDSTAEGLLVVSHISNLAEINESLGQSDTDATLKKMGAALQNYCDKTPKLIAARFSGADFAVFSNKMIDNNTLCSEIKELLNKASGLGKTFTNFDLQTVSSIVTKPKLSGDIEDEKQHTDIMELVNEKHTTLYEGKDEAEWRTMLTSAIDANKFKLASFPVNSTSGDLIHYESPSRLQLKEGGPWLFAGEFIDWATKLDLVSKLDCLALETAIHSLKQDKKLALGLNVSTAAMFDPIYLRTLKKLTKNNHDIANRLWLEVTEACAFENMPQFKRFCDATNKLGCKMGVEHIGAEIGRLDELLDLNLNYIKIDASFTRGIDKNQGNQAFLKGICLSVQSIGLITIAEGVQTKSELKKLSELGVNAMTGPVVK